MKRDARKGGRAKGKSLEADRINRYLDNIRIQIGKHYQSICDHDGMCCAYADEIWGLKLISSELSVKMKRDARNCKRIFYAKYSKTDEVTIWKP